MSTRYVAFWYRSDASGIVADGDNEEMVRQSAYLWQDGMNALISASGEDREEYDVVVEALPSDEAEALIAFYGEDTNDFDFDPSYEEEDDYMEIAA